MQRFLEDNDSLHVYYPLYLWLKLYGNVNFALCKIIRAIPDTYLQVIASGRTLPRVSEPVYRIRIDSVYLLRVNYSPGMSAVLKENNRVAKIMFLTITTSQSWDRWIALVATPFAILLSL